MLIANALKARTSEQEKRKQTENKRKDAKYIRHTQSQSTRR